MIARALAVLLFLAGCASWPSGETPLNVMTFNIRLNLASDGPNAWPHRKELVARMISSQKADLVGLQEALPEQLEDLATLLPDYARFGDGRSAVRGGEFCAILYRKTRFEVLEHDTFWLSETPSVAGSKGWDGAHERILTWGRMRDRRTGQLFFHFNTHLDHVGKVARREGALLIVSRVADIAGNAPAILTGDFNDLPDSEPYRIIRRAGFHDALEISRTPHRGPMSSWNAFKAVEPDRRIDFVFVRGEVDVLRHTILPDTFGGRFPSDHLPVVAKVVLKDER